MNYRKLLLSLLLLGLSCGLTAVEKKSIILIPGLDSHGHGEHEFRAGCYLLAKRLNESGLPLNVRVIEEFKWPSADRMFEKADAIVVYSDGKHKHRLADDNYGRFKYFRDLAKKGKSIAFMHYACHVEKENSHYLFDMIGGCYLTGHSTNPHWLAESILNKKHPITQGVKPFKVTDEWYFNIKFTDKKGITSVLEAIPDDETRLGKTSHPKGPDKHIVEASGQKETLLWAYERQDGGRGFGFTGGHFHNNWAE
ncbi:MAG: ThuA domain-containing protein, partial [Lentisphaeraceae bacterium]|nr:ThuA domain-containing protein [Lentisphaeraceae bacterium]